MSLQTISKLKRVFNEHRVGWRWILESKDSQPREFKPQSERYLRGLALP
jgi:hypothetical protein